MRTALFFLQVAFSTRLWVPVFVCVGVYLTHYDMPTWFSIERSLLAAMAIAVVAILMISFTSYNVEGVRELVLDVFIDVFMLGFAFGSMVWLATGYYLASWQTVGGWYFAAAILLAAVDFGVTLYGGSSKLLEMDKVRTGSKLAN